MSTLVCFLCVTISVGMAAQIWKGRTGVGWGFLTFILMAFTWLFFKAVLSATEATDAEMAAADQLTKDLAVLSISGGSAFVLMMSIITILPSRKTTKADA